MPTTSEEGREIELRNPNRERGQMATLTPGNTKAKRWRSQGSDSETSDYTWLQPIGTGTKLAKLKTEEAKQADVNTRVDILEQAFNRNAQVQKETQAYVNQLSVHRTLEDTYHFSAKDVQTERTAVVIWPRECFKSPDGAKSKLVDDLRKFANIPEAAVENVMHRSLQGAKTNKSHILFRHRDKARTHAYKHRNIVTSKLKCLEH
jgi:hypothetical protein